MKIQLFNVSPSVPEELAFLETLSKNLWWSWNIDANELFRRINPILWNSCNCNPLEFLDQIPQSRFEALVKDDPFLQHLDRVKARFERNVLKPEDPEANPDRKRDIAYFSLEYGIHESVRLYSGGLGVLAGDHLKAASDLDLPLAAVGLLYRQGYFQQYLNSDGWQQERYAENEVHKLPLQPVFNAENQHMLISIPMPDGQLKAAIWQLNVGRIPLFLLDANIPENPEHLRTVTAALYGGDKVMRLRQELLLGIGGVRALTAMGFTPKVFHINEGHAAFLNLERISRLMKDKGLSIDEALEITQRTSVFTTHTPVPAGNETFTIDLLTPYLKVLEPELGIAAQDVIKWGQPDVGSEHGKHELSMTVLGLRMAHRSNGVSRLHGKVARKMWSHLWPGREQEEVPIDHITNGIHVASFCSSDNIQLFERYLSTAWRKACSPSDLRNRIKQIPDEELWRAHELGRSHLIRYIREHMESQYSARNATRSELAQVKSVFDHDALTIGFARRFATYKRGTLLLRDPERLERLLVNEDRPVQIIFAGKAHPADDHGKEFIRQIVQFSRKANVRRKIVFLENYDLNMARHMVQGVDVWLNTPRRPQEASGTSGMKAAINGALNLSILDGWWCEGYNKDTGWAIGKGEEYSDHEFQDNVEAHALFNLLENEIVPCFYDRQYGDMPARWIQMMKASIMMGLEQFTSHRMVSDYDHRFYKPASGDYDSLMSADEEKAKALARQRARFQELWSGVSIDLPSASQEVSTMHVGDKFTVTTTVQLGSLTPDEVDVGIYYGQVNSMNKITRICVDKMKQVESKGKGSFVYLYEIECQAAGRYGFTTRVTPKGDEWTHVMPGFITWANGTAS